MSLLQLLLSIVIFALGVVWFVRLRNKRSEIAKADDNIVVISAPPSPFDHVPNDELTTECIPVEDAPFSEIDRFALSFHPNKLGFTGDDLEHIDSTVSKAIYSSQKTELSLTDLRAALQYEAAMLPYVTLGEPSKEKQEYARSLVSEILKIVQGPEKEGGS